MDGGAFRRAGARPRSVGALSLQESKGVGEAPKARHGAGVLPQKVTPDEVRQRRIAGGQKRRDGIGSQRSTP